MNLSRTEGDPEKEKYTHARGKGRKTSLRWRKNCNVPRILGGRRGNSVKKRHPRENRPHPDHNHAAILLGPWAEEEKRKGPADFRKGKDFLKGIIGLIEN